MRAGVDLNVGRRADLIAKVDCKFRPVAKHGVKGLKLWANWCYERGEFPVPQRPSTAGLNSLDSNRILSRASWRLGWRCGVTYVSHDADAGAWQFLGDSMSD